MSNEVHMHAVGGFRLRSTWIVLLLCLGSCAYFNTFYNARQLFKQAETARVAPGAAQLAGSNEYRACIEKCLQLMRFHPNSKYVDDSLYLVGMSHLHLGEYIQSQASFQDLLDRFPESEYAERAYFNIGVASLRLGDAGGAATAFATLQELYPQSKYNVEAAFRTAESQLDSRDYEAARQELTRFMQRYPKSPFVVDAQVQLARTYYNEERFGDSRRAYSDVLKKDISQELRYEAELHIALAEREDAELVLSDPALYTSADLPKGLSLDFLESADESAGVADTSGVAASESVAAAPQTPPVDAGSVLTAAQETLPESLRVMRQAAEEQLAKAAQGLVALQKQATKLGREFEHRIEVAVTQAALGQPEEAITELDVIARSKPRSEIAARALFEMAEILRRTGELRRARESYDNAGRQTRGSAIIEEARAKSAAIQARSQALEKLRKAPEVVRRYRIAHGLEQPRDDEQVPPADSLKAMIALETEYDELAAQLLRVAEIDLFELDQPRVALHEFKRVLEGFPGSAQGPRAAFAIGWIYDNVLLDSTRAQAAYETVLREYPESPQAREASDLLASRNAAPSSEVMDPSSRP